MSNVECIALVAKTTNLQKIPFVWHIMSSEDYERQVKAKGDMKRFDFIHMIQVLRLYFLDIQLRFTALFLTSSLSAVLDYHEYCKLLVNCQSVSLSLSNEILRS